MLSPAIIFMLCAFGDGLSSHELVRTNIGLSTTPLQKNNQEKINESKQNHFRFPPPLICNSQKNKNGKNSQQYTTYRNLICFYPPCFYPTPILTPPNTPFVLDSLPVSILRGRGSFSFHVRDFEI